MDIFEIQAPAITSPQAIQTPEVKLILKYNPDKIVDSNGVKYAKDATSNRLPRRMAESHITYAAIVGKNTIMTSSQSAALVQTDCSVKKHLIICSNIPVANKKKGTL